MNHNLIKNKKFVDGVNVEEGFASFLCSLIWFNDFYLFLSVL